MTLSVIIPVYNAEKTIERAISSVIHQSVKNIEIILIDDGSTDKSSTICQNFCENNKNILYFRQNNKGLSAARNVGIQHAQGTYLTFLDADDWIDNDYYHDMIQTMKENEVQMVMTGYTREFWGEKTCHRKSLICVSTPKEICFEKKDSVFFTKTYSYNIFIHVWNKLYLRDIIISNNIGFDENLRYAEDVPFNIQYYKNIKQIFITTSCGYHYRHINTKSLTSKWTTNLMESNRQTYCKIRNFINSF